ncbi:MAG: hypothetical protein ACETWQ_12195 [Phycisphaerae bacterium]
MRKKRFFASLRMTEGGGQGMSNIEQGISNDEGWGTDVGDVQSMHKS